MYARMLIVGLSLTLAGCQYNRVTVTSKVTALTPTPVTFEGAVTLERDHQPASVTSAAPTRLVSLGRPTTGE